MAVAATLRGFMLLPAVLLHVVVAGALLPQLLVRRPGFPNDLITVRIADSPIKYPYLLMAKFVCPWSRPERTTRHVGVVGDCRNGRNIAVFGASVI
jgi:hypothetical protein